MEQIREVINAKLDELLPSDKTPPTRLHEAMRYSVFSGAKRIRPVLCIAVCEALGGSREDAIVPACALEALHTYTLIHDDLPAMDNDDMRRGKLTCHKKFDEATAILAGDGLLTISFEWFGMHGDIRLVQELAKYAGSLGIVGGQQDDMQYKTSMPNREDLFSMQEKKTAYLFSVSCIIGAMCASASESDVEHMRSFGKNLGRAFQLLDDICDNDPVTMSVIGREETMNLAEKYKADSYRALETLANPAQLRDILDFTYSSFKL
ncbi:MAG: polyprenyl synthetase family protein [Candidatus Andersenbacteria bacterium]